MGRDDSARHGTTLRSRPSEAFLLRHSEAFLLRHSEAAGRRIRSPVPDVTQKDGSYGSFAIAQDDAGSERMGRGFPDAPTARLDFVGHDDSARHWLPPGEGYGG